jgi:hypothetical protein
MGEQRGKGRGSKGIGVDEKLGEMVVEGEGKETNFGRALWRKVSARSTH